jgi:TonB family protein
MSRIVTRAVPFVAGLAVFLNTAHAEEVTTAKSKPTVYNHIIRENDPRDKAIESAYAKKFTIVEVRDSKEYTGAVLKHSVHPRPVLNESGHELKGRVAVVMVVTSDGRVVEPFILESTDKRLNTAALDAVRQWREAPARLNGSPVSSVEWTVFGNGKEENTAEIIHMVTPQYRADLRKWHIQGTVLVLLHVRPDGSVQSVDTIQSSGNSTLDEQAKEAFLGFRFRPGRSMNVKMAMTFSLMHGVYMYAWH